MIEDALRLLIGLMMLLMLLAMGMAVTVAELGAALRRGRALGIGFVVNFLAIPVLMMLLVNGFGIDKPVAVGLILCAVAPGSGVGPLVVDYARGDVGMSVGLLLGLTIGSVLLTPILLSWWVGGDAGGVLSTTTWPTMRLIFAFQLAPLAVGLLLRRYSESRTRRMQPWIARIARWLMLGIIAAYLVTQGQQFLANGLGPLVVSLAAIIASFLIGLWSPLRARAGRVALGLVSMNRNLALALLLATALFPGRSTLGVIVTYGILMLAVSFAIAAFVRRSSPAPGGMRDAGEGAAEA